MKISSFRVLLVLLLPCLTIWQQKMLFAQTPPASVELQSGFENNAPPKHYLGWGLSAAVGDLNRGDDAGNLMATVFYVHRLDIHSELELTLNYLAIQKLHGSDDFGVFPDSAAYTTLAWQADALWNVHPFEGKTLWRNLRVGIGPSLRYLTALVVPKFVSRGSFPLVVVRNPQGGLDTLATAPIGFQESEPFQGLALGAVIKVEYIMPLAPTIDLIARAQVHSYLPSVILSRFPAPFGIAGANLGSAGIFLRVGW